VGFLKCSRPKGGDKICKIIILNENLDFLRIKCPNLHSQTKEHDLLELLKIKNSKTCSNYWSALVLSPRQLAKLESTTKQKSHLKLNIYSQHIH